MAHETGRFVAVDVDGREHIVVMESVKGESDPTIELRTANGMRLRRVEKGVYEVIQTWRILRSSDPSAP